MQLSFNSDCNDDAIHILLAQFFIFSSPLIVVNYRLINIISNEKRLCNELTISKMIKIKIDSSKDILLANYWTFDRIEWQCHYGIHAVILYFNKSTEKWRWNQLLGNSNRTTRHIYKFSIDWKTPSKILYNF